jgi:hypothetical protein
MNFSYRVDGTGQKASKLDELKTKAEHLKTFLGEAWESLNSLNEAIKELEAELTVSEKLAQTNLGFPARKISGGKVYELVAVFNSPDARVNMINAHNAMDKLRLCYRWVWVVKGKAEGHRAVYVCEYTGPR